MVYRRPAGGRQCAGPQLTRNSFTYSQFDSGCPVVAGSRGSQIFLKAAGGEMEVRRRSAMRDLSPKAATGQLRTFENRRPMTAFRDSNRHRQSSRKLYMETFRSTTTQDSDNRTRRKRKGWVVHSQQSLSVSVTHIWH